MWGKVFSREDFGQNRRIAEETPSRASPTGCRNCQYAASIGPTIELTRPQTARRAPAFNLRFGASAVWDRVILDVGHGNSWVKEI